MRLWCPGAQRDYVANDNGRLMLGGPSRAVWHTTEGSTIAGALSVYRGKGFWPHITWDPRDGQIQQHLPADVAARALRPGSVPTNRLGVVCIQIEVVARAEVPFTSRLMHRFPELLAWLDSLGIPRTWPAGRPLAYGPDERRPGVVPAAYGETTGPARRGSGAATAATSDTARSLATTTGTLVPSTSAGGCSRRTTT